MKFKPLYIAFLFFILFGLIYSQQSTNDTTQQKNNTLNTLTIQLDKPYTQKLSQQNQFQGKYRIKIPQDKIKALKQDKWYLFVEVQTKQQFAWQKTKIQLYSIVGQNVTKKLKQCDTQNGLDSCFLTNKNFDYLKQTIEAKVKCQQNCQFTISATISTKYKIQPNTSLQLNFQNTAYTKLFYIDTNNIENFKRLQITVRAKNFLSFSSPIRLYANKDQTIPTQQKHDYKGVHLWDDGLGLFINYPDASGKFTILIEGPQKNILYLESTIITNNVQVIQTKQYQPSFSYIQANQKQQFKIKVLKNQKTNIKLTTLTGSVQMSSIKDQDKKDIQTEFTSLSRTYGQLQYKLDPTFFVKHSNFKINDYIYIEIKGNKDSTFVFQSYSDNATMNRLISQVNRYATLDKKSSDFYYIKLSQSKDDVNQKNKQARIQLMTTTFSDIELNTKVFLCKQQNISKCQPTKQQQQKINKGQKIQNTIMKKQITNISIDKSIPGVRYYDIVINYNNDFVLLNGVYKIYLIVVLTNSKQEDVVYTVQYVNLGQTYFLKEKQLKKDRLSMQEIKYYTFINNDLDISSIKIHSTEISGEILLKGYRQDPRYNLVEGKQIYEFHNMITFDQIKKGDQIFLEVHGIQNAYYSLYLQLIRQSEIKPDDKNNKGYNEIIVQTDIQYDFFIKAKEKMIVQLHPKQKEFELWISSHLPLDLCMTQIIDKPPFKPNCQVTQILSKSQRLTISMDKGLIGNMGITNNNDKAVEFKIAIKPLNTIQTCINAPLGLLNKWAITLDPKTKKTKKICYKFNINRRQNLQIIVDMLNLDYQNSTTYWQLNDKEKQIMLNEVNVIWKKQLQKICGEEKQNSKCQLTIIVESPQETMIQNIVQYLDKDVQLVDGMAHPSYTPPQSNDPKYFRYQLINFLNTTIILQNKVGYYTFYGKVLQRSAYLGKQRQKIYPNQKDHLFKSQNPFYYLYQTYILSQDLIKKSNCTRDCVLLISVVPDNNELRQEMGRFSLQCSQQDRFLKQNQPIVGYLEGKSLAFYQYYNPSNGTIYIQVHNQNNKACAKIYLKKGNDVRATPSAFDKMSENQNSLIYENAQQGTYAITLQGKHFGCSYTIQALNSNLNIARLKRGIFSDKTLQANDTIHFIYEHNQNQSFKVITLNRAGQLQLKIKPIQRDQLDKLLINDPKKSKQFQSQIRYQQANVDLLRIQNNHIYFCFKCTYLITAKASKYTQTSIVIPSKDVQIPINKDALVKDLLRKNQTTKYRIFTSNLAKYQIYVQYGQIKLKIVETVQNKVVIEKVYNATKNPIYETFNSSSRKLQFIGEKTSDIVDFIHYSIVTIEGLDNSSFYSFQLLSDENQNSAGKVKYGIPQYFYLDQKTTKCFEGILDDQSEEFIVSFQNIPRKTVQKINITVNVNNKSVDFKPIFGLSQMAIELNDIRIKQPSPYTVCFKSAQIVSLTFIQSAKIIILPPDTTVFIPKQANLTFGCKGPIIMEIDECSARSILSVSSSFNNLHTSDTQISHVRRSNNLIEFNHWGPVYIHLWSQGSRIRWRNKDTYTESGVGYDKFSPSNIITYVQNDKLKVEIKPIQQLSQYNKQDFAKIIEITYKAILAQTQDELRSSMNCDYGNSIRYEKKVQSRSQKVTPQFSLEQLRQNFKKQKYFFIGVVASLNIQVNKTIESYRFNYPIVDIQRSVISNQIGPFVSEENSHLTWAIYLIFIGILIGAGFCVYKKWIKKWFRSRKQRLSDQTSDKFKYTQFASLD